MGYVYYSGGSVSQGRPKPGGARSEEGEQKGWCYRATPAELSSFSCSAIGLARMGEEAADEAAEVSASRGGGSNEGTGLRRGEVILLARETPVVAGAEAGVDSVG